MTTPFINLTTPQNILTAVPDAAALPAHQQRRGDHAHQPRALRRGQHASGHPALRHHRHPRRRGRDAPCSEPERRPLPRGHPHRHLRPRPRHPRAAAARRRPRRTAQCRYSGHHPPDHTHAQRARSLDQPRYRRAGSHRRLPGLQRTRPPRCTPGRSWPHRAPTSRPNSRSPNPPPGWRSTVASTTSSPTRPPSCSPRCVAGRFCSPDLRDPRGDHCQRGHGAARCAAAAGCWDG